MRNRLIIDRFKDVAIDFHRLNALRDFISDQKAQVCSERCVFYTDIFKKNDSQPMIIKKAMAFSHTLDNMSLYVLEKSRIVGNIASKPFSAPIFMEYSVDWIVDEIDTFEHRLGDVFYVDEKVKRDIKDCAVYWKGKTHQDQVKRTLTERVKKA